MRARRAGGVLRHTASHRGGIALSLLAVATVLPPVASEWECPAGSISGSHGIAACCPAACGHCGGRGCEEREGGRQACCALDIQTAGRACNGAAPPCVPLKATPLLAIRQRTHDTRSTIASHSHSAAARLLTPDGKNEWIDKLWLSHPAVIWRCDARPGAVALTFDDGPAHEFSTGLADELRELGVSATFFVTGQRASNDPDTVRRLHLMGHQIGSHSFNHVSFQGRGRTNTSFYRDELEATEAAILAALPPSSRPRWHRHFRPPYLELDRDAADELMERGYTIIQVSVDTKDWEGGKYSTQERLESVFRGHPARGGGLVPRTNHSHIVLQHSTFHSSTKSLTRLLVGHFRRAGYRFVRVEECMASRERDIIRSGHSRNAQPLRWPLRSRPASPHM